MSDHSNEAQRLTRHYNPTIVKQHIAPGTEHKLYRFENGYGASVIPEYELQNVLDATAIIPNCLEVAVIYWDAQDDFHLLSWDDALLQERLGWYDNPIRRINQEQVDNLLDQIAGL